MRRASFSSAHKNTAGRSKSRAKAAAEHAAALGAEGTDDIDEDALRLEILQEMLAERQKNREEQG